MYWSTDNATWNQNTTALSTSCNNIGSTPSYAVGTTFYFVMSNPTAGGPSNQGWSTNLTSGVTCPGTTTSCTSNSVTTVTSGTLTVALTGNTASGIC